MWSLRGTNELTVRCLKLITSSIRNSSTKPSTNGDIKPHIYNRNPRNLEKLRVEKKPTGYVLDDVFVEYWHKLELTQQADYVVAQIIHNTKKVVVEASTNEWAIYKHLYSKNDKMAYIILARVFAERCLETGLYSFACNITTGTQDSKVSVFLRILEEEGLSLSEPKCFNFYDKYYKNEKKPWTVLEDKIS